MHGPLRVLRFYRPVSEESSLSATHVGSLHSSRPALMLPPSRRDQLTFEPLLPFINREITAYPEQRDPARRTARRQDVAQATMYFKGLRAAEEDKKDRELRAKLDESLLRTCLLYTSDAAEKRIV